MNYHLTNSDRTPTPAELVAFVDGHLDALRARQVELWLAVHPGTAATVEEHRQILRQVSDLVPPEPAEATWEQVWTQIDAALPVLGQEPRWLRRRVLAVVAGIAALVLLMIPSHVSRPEPRNAIDFAGTPLLLASADEVEIVSIDGADVRTLLVGEPPLRRPFELASVDDVELNFAEAGEQGWIPAMGGGEFGTPMYVVPMP